MVILKFGGTSVGEVGAIRRVAEIVAAEPRPRVVVVSALAGVTDALLQLAAAHPPRGAARTLEGLRERHVAAAALVRNPAARDAVVAEMDAIAGRLAATLDSAAGAITARERDEVAAAGELWSSHLMTAVLQDRAVPAAWIDARHVLRTDSTYGAAAPDVDVTRTLAARILRPSLDAGIVPVLGGFIGADAHGVTTTLGRGGSDCSAAVVGACLDAEEIQIWTDVDGVLTADPRVIPHARLVPHLSYGEAHDLASFGAKVLHPGTIQPAVERGIPVLVRNSHRPDAPGTVVSASERPEHSTVAGLACRPGATLVEAVARDASELFVTGVFDRLRAARLEAVLADRCGDRLAFTVHDLDDAESLRASLAEVADVRIRGNMATVCVVGEGLASRIDVEAEALKALRELPVHLVARPSGQRTLAFVVEAAHTKGAMARLHDCFFGAGAPRARVPGTVVRA